VKKKIVTSKDKTDWDNFINNTGSLYDKDSAESLNHVQSNKIKKIDLHGFPTNSANEEVKKFIIKSYEEGYKKLIIVTGKGLRSKVYSDPFRSDKLNILRYSVPNFIKNETNLMNVVKKISQADIKDGGEGAIYLFLKNKNKIKE
tara:strand:- start:134 stop:568 length:435 start_codon:yes stop_codon:yes gene_type:complete